MIQMNLHQGNLERTMIIVHQSGNLKENTIPIHYHQKDQKLVDIVDLQTLHHHQKDGNIRQDRIIIEVNIKISQKNLSVNIPLIQTYLHQEM